MKKSLFLFIIIVWSTSLVEVFAQKTFNNPLLPSGPDPWIIYHDGFYYYTNTGGNQLKLWKVRSIEDLAKTDAVTVWTPPGEGSNSDKIWAPEIHRFDGKWYIYYTATDKVNGGDDNRWVFVLENESNDPLKGKWVDKGKINTNHSGLDGTVFEFGGVRYFVYSAYIGPQSVLCIAKMLSPWKISDVQPELAFPKYEWEKQGGRQILEGPEFLLGPKDKMFIVYSASACWSDDYSLGMLTIDKNANPLDPNAWSRSDHPVFMKAPENNVYATGHNAFFKSPDGKEDWILYHANTGPEQKTRQRSPRAQKFIWNKDGTPNFGKPLKVGIPIAVPSGN